MDNLLLDAAAQNFEAAQDLAGPAQSQRMALGLMQVARAVKGDSRSPALMDAAAQNFEAAQDLSGQRQTQRVALGLMQFARALKR